MCGRVFQTLNVNQLLRAAGTNLVRNSNRHQVSYNMGPTNYVPAVRHHSSAENNHRELDMMKWGYEAPFGQFIINARVEEAHEKKTFKPLINSNRCVMIVEGYFEWTPNKEPFAFRTKADKQNEGDLPPLMYIAALYGPDETLILLTREALRGFHEVHERMPVILDESEIDMWLDCEKYKFEKIIFSEILNEKKEKWSKVYRYQVGPLVNSIKNKSDKVILSLEDYKKELDKTGIKRFFQPTKKDKEKEEKKEDKKDEKVTIKLEKPEKEPAKGVESTQFPDPTQSTMAPDSQDAAQYQEQKPFEESKENEKTDVERAIEKSGSNKEESSEEETKQDDPNLNKIQQTIDEAGLGKDFGGFIATNAYIMTKKGDKSGSKATEKGSKKRKEPTNSDENVQGGLKQLKLTSVGKDDEKVA